MIFQHLDKNNLHHAYLIEGMRDEIIPEILVWLESLGVKTSANPDFCQILIDNFKKEEAMDLRSMGSEKSFGAEKKIFIVGANSFSLDAQNILLKMFEEPIENTHFFLIVPDAHILLRTLVSRFYLISSRQGLAKDRLKEAEKFIALPLNKRIEFIKLLIAEEESDNKEEIVVDNSARSKALEFLDTLELVLHNKFVQSSTLNIKTDFFEQIFTAREFLRQPGSSVKSLMESVALTIPIL